MKMTNVISLMICLFLHAVSVWGQSVEPADSIIYELQEVIVTAGQPATKLVGSTLVTTIPGSNLADIGDALDVLAQLPMIKVEDNTVSIIGKNNYAKGTQSLVACYRYNPEQSDMKTLFQTIICCILTAISGNLAITVA